MKSIGLIIVSYNSAGELSTCVEAARKSARNAKLTDRVVIVDNNSKDDSVKIATQSKATVIANKQNLGFAKAVNQGINKALALGADYIIILNPDVTMGLDSIAHMAACFERADDIGAVGPSLTDSRGKDATSGYYQKTPSWISVSLFSTFLRPRAIRSRWLVERFYEYPYSGQSHEVDQIPGGCLMTTKQVLGDVGLLDEDFAIWFEDVEWCYRVKQKGYRQLLCAEAKVAHIGGKSFEQWQDLNKAVTFYVSMKTFFNKHKPISGILVRLALIINSLALTIKNRDKSNLIFLKRFLTEKRGKLPS